MIFLDLCFRLYGYKTGNSNQSSTRNEHFYVNVPKISGKQVHFKKSCHCVILAHIFSSILSCLTN